MRRAKAPKQLTAAPAPNGDVRKQLVGLIRSNQGCGTRFLAEKLGKTPGQVGNLLRELMATGAVKKAGGGPNTTYSTR